MLGRSQELGGGAIGGRGARSILFERKKGNSGCNEGGGTVV